MQEYKLKYVPTFTNEISKELDIMTNKIIYGMLDIYSSTSEEENINDSSTSEEVKKVKKLTKKKQDIINCACGGKFQYNNKSNHEKSIRHNKYIQSKNNKSNKKSLK